MSSIVSHDYAQCNDLYHYPTVCIVSPHCITTAIFSLQKPITTFLTELQFVGDEDLLLEMIPLSVLCQNYVHLRLQLRRYNS